MTLALSIVLFVIVAGVIMLFGYRRYVLPGRVYEGLDSGAGFRAALTDASNREFFTVRGLPRPSPASFPLRPQPLPLFD